MKGILKVRAASLVLLVALTVRFSSSQGLDDPLLSEQWHLINRGLNGARAGIDLHLTNTWQQFRGKGVVIGIVDDGIDLNHPDLAAHIDRSLAYDWNDGDTDPQADADKGDFHGTECAGAAAAIGNNAEGIAGVAFEATIAPLRLISDESTDATEAEAILFKNQRIHIKSNSWGPEDDGQTLEAPGPLSSAALAEAITTGRGGRGTIFLWPAGNGRDVQDNANYDGWANSIYSITIGSVSDQGFQADFSEPGACVLVCAPSGSLARPGIVTTDLGGDRGNNGTGEPNDLADLDYTRSFVGTSASVALAAGGVALVLEANPNLGWRDVQEILLRSAKQVDEHHPDWDVNAAGLRFNHSFGAGLMQVDEAVALALEWRNLTAQTIAHIAKAQLQASIPDNAPTGVEVVFDFGATNLRVEHVTLTVEIKHPARGDLAITLISPSGMESRLAEPHNDQNSDYSDWKFSSVRHWGENAQGLWRVRIADLKSENAGVVNSLRLELLGTDGGPPNPVSIEAVKISDVSGGNGNNAAEPGEVISGLITLETDLTNGLAQVRSRTPGAQVVPDSVAMTNGTVSFQFKIAEWVPCRSTLLFDLITASDGIFCTNSFRQKIGPPPATWNLTTIDSGGVIGSYTSLAVDQAGRAQVSYFDVSNGNLKYAAGDRTGWRIEPIDTEGDVGSYSSLALNAAGQPRIAYRDTTRRRLKFAAWTGTEWQIETVPTETNAGSFCSLALAQDGSPRIAFQDEANGDLLYAAKIGGSWDVQTAESGSNSDISLALAADDSPLISYRDTVGKTLRFAERAGGVWKTETIDSDGSVGFNTSLRIGRDGQPRIAYRDSSNADLKYAVRSGGGWKTEVVDREGAVGSDASLALGAADRPHISYRDVSNNSLKHAFWNGGFWSLETVDANGSVGAYSSIALDGDGRIWISYRDTSNGDLKAAFRESSDCAVFEVPELAIQSEGAFIHLTWNRSADFVLEQTADLIAPVWTTIASQTADVGGLVSVVIPQSGRMSFFRLRSSP